MPLKGILPREGLVTRRTREGLDREVYPLVTLEVMRALERLWALITFEGTFASVRSSTAGSTGYIGHLLLIRHWCRSVLSVVSSTRVSWGGAVGASLPLGSVLRTLTRVRHLIGIHATILRLRLLRLPSAVRTPIRLCWISTVATTSWTTVNMCWSLIVTTSTVLWDVHWIVSSAALTTALLLLLLSLLRLAISVVNLLRGR